MRDVHASQRLSVRGADLDRRAALRQAAQERERRAAPGHAAQVRRSVERRLELSRRAAGLDGDTRRCSIRVRERRRATTVCVDGGDLPALAVGTELHCGEATSVGGPAERTAQARRGEPARAARDIDDRETAVVDVRNRSSVRGPRDRRCARRELSWSAARQRDDPEAAVVFVAEPATVG